MTARDFWELASFVVTALGLPFAIVFFAWEQRKERDNEEEEAYLLLSNAYTDFLKVVLSNSDLQLRTPQLSVDLDREQIAALGQPVDQVQSALSAAYSSRQVSQIFAPDDEYQVMMQVAPEFQQNPAALSMLYVQGSGGRLIPLSSVVTVSRPLPSWTSTKEYRPL